MITHVEAESLISARLDGPLDPLAERELEGHLAACPQCRAFASQTTAMSRAFQQLPYLPASPMVSRAVMAKIQKPVSPQARMQEFLPRTLGPAFSTLAAVLVVVALSVFVLTQLVGQGGSGEDDTQILEAPSVEVTRAMEIAMDGRTPTTEVVPTATTADRPVQTPTSADNETLPIVPTFPAEEFPTSSAPTTVPTSLPTVAPKEAVTVEVVPTQPARVQPTTRPVEQPTEKALPTKTPLPDESARIRIAADDATVESRATESLTKVVPTLAPTQEPTSLPTLEPTATPTTEPAQKPTDLPTSQPTASPTAEPTQEPSAEPTEIPTEEPSPVMATEVLPSPTSEQQLIEPIDGTFASSEETPPIGDETVVSTSEMIEPTQETGSDGDVIAPVEATEAPFATDVAPDTGTQSNPTPEGDTSQPIEPIGEIEATPEIQGGDNQRGDRGGRTDETPTGATSGDGGQVATAPDEPPAENDLRNATVTGKVEGDGATLAPVPELASTNAPDGLTVREANSGAGTFLEICSSDGTCHAASEGAADGLRDGPVLGWIGNTLIYQREAADGSSEYRTAQIDAATGTVVDNLNLGTAGAPTGTTYIYGDGLLIETTDGWFYALSDHGIATSSGQVGSDRHSVQVFPTWGHVSYVSNGQIVIESVDGGGIIGVLPFNGNDYDVSQDTSQVVTNSGGTIEIWNFDGSQAGTFANPGGISVGSVLWTAEGNIEFVDQSTGEVRSIPVDLALSR